jgi:ParB family chromosome partitioning protein
LNELIPDLLELLDEKKLSFLVGVDLASLPVDKQAMVFDFITAENIKLSMKQARLLKENSDSITADFMRGLLKKETSAPRKVNPQILDKYFTAETPTKEVNDIIDKALTEFFTRKNAPPVESVQEYTADKSAKTRMKAELSSSDTSENV